RKGPIRHTGHFEESGSLIFQHACEMNLEGIISKLREAPYRSGRSENFIKTKCHNAQEFVVVGFTPSAAMPNAIGALSVAFHENGELRYAGRVGTGYTHETSRDLWKRLKALRADRAPVTLPKNERRKTVICSNRNWSWRPNSAASLMTACCGKPPTRDCARTNQHAKWCAKHQRLPILRPLWYGGPRRGRQCRGWQRPKPSR